MGPLTTETGARAARPLLASVIMRTNGENWVDCGPAGSGSGMVESRHLLTVNIIRADPRGGRVTLSRRS
jgi:hypothetical protein